MENLNKGSNSLIKTLVFLIIVSLYCLLFFGLGDSNKTDMQLASFGFIMFAILVVYLSSLLPGVIGSKRLTTADAVSAGMIYAIAAFIINHIVVFTEMKTLVVINFAAILAYLLLFTIVVSMKKK
jgi:hypothetical protein